MTENDLESVIEACHSKTGLRGGALLHQLLADLPGVKRKRIHAAMRRFDLTDGPAFVPPVKEAEPTPFIASHIGSVKMVPPAMLPSETVAPALKQRALEVSLLAADSLD